MKKLLLAGLFPIFSGLAVALPSFKITNESAQGNVERMVKVQLNDRLSEAEIKKIAEAIYRPGYKQTLIHYHLAGDISSKTWAVSNYTPALQVQIFGQGTKEVRTLQEHNPLHEGEVIGSWLQDGDIAYRITLVKAPSGSFKAHFYYSDKTVGTPRNLTAKHVAGQLRYYVDILQHREFYYFVSADGNLQHWDGRNGMVNTSTVVKN